MPRAYQEAGERTIKRRPSKETGSRYHLHLRSVGAKLDIKFSARITNKTIDDKVAVDVIGREMEFLRKAKRTLETGHVADALCFF